MDICVKFGDSGLNDGRVVVDSGSWTRLCSVKLHFAADWKKLATLSDMFVSLIVPDMML